MPKNVFTLNTEKELEQEFHISRYIIFYKLILGIIELILGLGIWIWGKTILVVYEQFKSEQLLEDPHDFLGVILQRTMPFVSEHLTYLIFILILLGIVKIIGAYGLLKNKHWGLDILIIVTLVLLPFELYSLFTHFSSSRIAYFIINLLIALYLVNFKPRQYFKKIKARYVPSKNLTDSD